MCKVRSENDCGAHKMHLAWGSNLAWKSQPQPSQNGSKYLNITSLCMKLLLFTSNTHLNIRKYFYFLSFWQLLELFLSLTVSNESNLAQIFNKTVFFSPK